MCENIIKKYKAFRKNGYTASEAFRKAKDKRYSAKTINKPKKKNKLLSSTTGGNSKILSNNLSK